MRRAGRGVLAHGQLQRPVGAQDGAPVHHQQQVVGHRRGHRHRNAQQLALRGHRGRPQQGLVGIGSGLEFAHRRPRGRGHDDEIGCAGLGFDERNRVAQRVEVVVDFPALGVVLRQQPRRWGDRRWCGCLLGQQRRVGLDDERPLELVGEQLAHPGLAVLLAAFIQQLQVI